MRKRILSVLWACLYVLTALLGLIPRPAGAGKVLLILTGLLFFVPPALLLWDAKKAGDRKVPGTVALLAGVSLSITLILLILNLLSARAGEAAGNMLNILLILLSAPMGCLQYWAVSLFGWACLLYSGLLLRRKQK